MGMFRVIAELMQYLLILPKRLVNFFRDLGYQRLVTSKAISMARTEAKSLTGMQKFLRGLGKVVLFFLALAIIIGVLWGLYHLNYVLDLERFLGGPLPWLRRYWLPVLVVLFFLTAWVGRKLWKMLGPEKNVIEFPDIEEAWIEAMATMVEAGINVTSAPLYLVLGRPRNGIDPLFVGSRLAFPVRQAPLRAKTPLQVYANQQGIFVAGFGTSLLGKLEEQFYDKPVQDWQPAAPQLRYVFEEPPGGADDNGPRADAPAPAVNLLAPMEADLAVGGGSALATLSAYETEGTPVAMLTRRKPVLPKLRKAEEIETEKQRLAYLCRRIVHARQPFCTLNGVLAVVPFEGLESEEDANQLANVLQQDLEIIRDVAKTRCPLVVAVADLESAPGYRAFVDNLEPDRRLRLLGRDFPLLPDLKPDDLPAMVEGGVDHFLETLHQVVFKLFRIEKPTDNAAWVSATNSKLFEFLGSLSSRRNALDRLLQRVVLPDLKLGFWLGGVFFGGTGFDPDRDQAFVPGVFRQLIEQQNWVAWSDRAMEEESDYQRWTMLGYGALGLFCIAAFAMILYRWRMIQS